SSSRSTMCCTTCVPDEARTGSDARHRALAGTVCQMQHVGCRSERWIAGSYPERQGLAPQDAREHGGRRRIDADGPHLDAIGAIDAERAVSVNHWRRKLTVPATDDEIAAVNCHRQTSAVAGPSAHGQGRVARLCRCPAAGTSEETDETDPDRSPQ